MTETTNLIGYTTRISREMALDFGIVEPTQQEADERALRTHLYRMDYRDAWQTYMDARAALDGITSPVVRDVLDLHRPTTLTCPRCDGCDAEGYDCEPPSWPCRTTSTIAAHYGIPLPDMDIYREPEEIR